MLSDVTEGTAYLCMGQGRSKPMSEGFKTERSYTRPYGTSLGTPVDRQQQYQSAIYYKFGTRVATVTAHYEHKPVPATPDSTVNSRTLPQVDNRVYATPSPLKGKHSDRKNKPKEATILESGEPIYENID